MPVRLTAAAIAAVLGAALGAAAPVPLPKAQLSEHSRVTPTVAQACVCPGGRSAPTIASISATLASTRS